MACAPWVADGLFCRFLLEAAVIFVMEEMNMEKRILTGDRTTGRLHLGHYVGSLLILNRVPYRDILLA